LNSGAVEILNQAPVWFLIVTLIFGMVLIAVLFGIVIYLLKDLKARFEKDIHDESLAREKLSEGCERCRSDLPKTYVFRDDFIREIALLGRKIELTFAEVKDLREEFTGFIKIYGKGQANDAGS